RVEEGGEARQAQQPGQGLERLAVTPGRITEKYQQQQETDVTGAQHLAGDRVKCRGNDLVDGEQQGDVEQRLRPFAGAGMQPLAFAHGITLSLQDGACRSRLADEATQASLLVQGAGWSRHPGLLQPAEPASGLLQNAGFLVEALSA